jgi:DNA-binding response OmpR family regulator
LNFRLRSIVSEQVHQAMDRRDGQLGIPLAPREVLAGVRALMRRHIRERQPEIQFRSQEILKTLRR